MKRHATDAVSLFFGLAFLGIAVAFLFYKLTDAQVPDVRWFLAGGLILLGLMGIFGAVRPRRTDTPAVEDEPVEAEVDGADTDAAVGADTGK